MLLSKIDSILRIETYFMAEIFIEPINYLKYITTYPYHFWELFFQLTGLNHKFNYENWIKFIQVKIWHHQL